MLVNHNIAYVKEHISELDGKDFNDALLSFSNNDALLISLLNSLGHFDVQKENKGSLHSYYLIDRGTRVDLVTYDASGFNILGSAVEDMKSAFGLITAIEGKLSYAMQYPPELRKKAINSVISDSGVTEEFYRMILSNWKEFR